MVLSSFSAMSQNVVPCLIFTGNSDTRQCVDLSIYNRINFNEEGFTISSSQDDSVKEVQILYATFNRISIGDDVPNASNGIGDVSVQNDSQLMYISDINALSIISGSTKAFNVGLFTLNGVLVARSTMFANDNLSLESISPNTYIAVATDGNCKLTLKFIIR